MHILIMAQHYAPEEVSGAALATELAEGLAQRGHKVTFVTCAPNYPYGRVFPGYRNVLRSVEECNDVTIIRVWSYITPNRPFWSRIWNFVTFSIMALLGGMTAEKPDVIFSYSPPLPLGVSAWLLGGLWRIPWVLRVEDLYPDTAIAAGVLRNRYAISLFKELEKFLYRKATHISLISEGFRKNLLAKGVPPEKLSVAPVWADVDEIRPLPKENGFRQKLGVQGKFLVLYAGNLGITSALEDVIAGAALLRDHSDVVFLVVGEGIKKDVLVQQAGGLKQVIFLPFQPRASIPEMFAAADLGLVTLNADSSPFSMPSKVFTIMASGRPVMAITPPDSEMAQLLETAQCGINVGNPQIFAQKILEIKGDPMLMNRWGENGRSYMVEYFSRKKCLDLYESMLQQVAA